MFANLNNILLFCNYSKGVRKVIISGYCKIFEVDLYIQSLFGR